MSEIDIRTITEDVITSIVFATDNLDGAGYCEFAIKLKQVPGGVHFEDRNGLPESKIRSSDFTNFLLALKKAEELGWFGE